MPRTLGQARQALGARIEAKELLALAVCHVATELGLHEAVRHSNLRGLDTWTGGACRWRHLHPLLAVRPAMISRWNVVRSRTIDHVASGDRQATVVDQRVDAQVVSIECSDGIKLSATAVVPVGDGSFPGALLLSGSGPLDRDSNTPGQDLDFSSTLASALGAVGIASLRFDKRGVGASSGDFISSGFDDETNDAATAFEALRRLGAVDPNRVGVIGHSVGATIAARLAADSESIAFAVLLGCAASSGAEVMAWQTDRIAEGLPGPSWTLGRQFRRKQVQLFERLDESTDDVIRSGKEEVPAKWLREYRVHSPLADFAAVGCPVLAITGGKDIQVNPLQLVRIKATTGGPCTTRTPANLTHVLRTSTHKPSIARYPQLLRQPVDHDLVETITTWTASHTKPSTAPDGPGGL